MKMYNQKLTLDRQVRYEIQVPGAFDRKSMDWDNGMKTSIEIDENNAPVTKITITVDQAGLHGLLHHLYSMGIPLISVNLS